MNLIRSIWNLLAPFINELVGLLAYGPWGKVAHSRLIDFYKWFYRIDWPDHRQFEKLGDFFLREKSFEQNNSALGSPVEAEAIETCRAFVMKSSLRVKGLEYRWRNFPELSDWGNESTGFFWNFYLHPRDYHWFHLPSLAKNLEARRVSGRFFPVNSFGRSICPFLYNENERLSFRWTHSEFGKVLMICVGAVGVSKIRSEIQDIPMDQEWQFVGNEYSKGLKIGAFELGSSVLLITERFPFSSKTARSFKPGESLIA